MNPDDLRKADAIEIVLGQGAKPGGGGMLLGQKITERVAGMRTLPVGIDQRSASRHPDWTGPDDLEIKIGELREITDWKKPIYVKIGASRPYYDTALAVKAGADVVVVDGMQGGTAATQQVFIENVGIPTLAAIPQAVQALQELGVHRKVQLIVSGGIRTGADVAKAMALGADAVAIGTAALIALGDNDPRYAAEYAALGSAAGFYDDFQDGRDPAGITTQDPELASRLDPVAGGRAAGQLPARADHGGADHRPRLRQVAPAQPRTRGPRGPDHRGVGHGPRPAGRHQLDPRRRHGQEPDDRNPPTTWWWAPAWPAPPPRGSSRPAATRSPSWSAPSRPATTPARTGPRGSSATPTRTPFYTRAVKESKALWENWHGPAGRS